MKIETLRKLLHLFPYERSKGKERDWKYFKSISLRNIIQSKTKRQLFIPLTVAFVCQSSALQKTLGLRARRLVLVNRPQSRP